MKNIDKNKKLMVQYGCGWSAPQNWLNFDSSPTLRFERIPLLGRFYTKNLNRFPLNVEFGDIVKGLPLASNSVDLLYCSHILEHLCLYDFRIALSNSWKILKPGGVFRIVVPDLKFIAHQYLSDNSENASINFCIDTSFGEVQRPRGIYNNLISILGNSHHRWMWDYVGLKSELEKKGFINIRQAYFKDSEDSGFADVEEEGRWLNCLGVQCSK